MEFTTKKLLLKNYYSTNLYGQCMRWHSQREQCNCILFLNMSTLSELGFRGESYRFPKLNVRNGDE